jgi:RimJ/RimL family protein N-acetyltransferase
MAAHSEITLNSAYPWGRSFDEYVAMFALSQEDLRSRIISCADGPASLNAQLNTRGHRIISCDPLYQFTADEIRSRIAQTRDLLIQRGRENSHLFVWNRIHSLEELSHLRGTAMRQFLADYDLGRQEGCYLNQSLPSLDFPNDSFDLALCSHFLFLYSEGVSLDFHIQSILEMLRIARDVRIFPLRNMQAEPSPRRPDNPDPPRLQANNRTRRIRIPSRRKPNAPHHARTDIMNPLLLDIPTELTSDRILLRAVRPGGGTIVFPSVRESLAELKIWMPWATDDYNGQGAEEWCRRNAAHFIERKGLQYLILLRETHHHIGTMGAFNFNWEIPSGEIGYWLHTAHTGQGFMTEAVKTLTEMLQHTLNFNRICIKTDEQNQKSRRVAELTGYQLEGILRNDSLTAAGRLRNTCIYSKIAVV